MSTFTMPSLGADMEFGTVQEWLVKPGDTVHRGDLMAVVDTDKAAVEIESFQDGVVESLLVEPGSRVPVGTALATFAGTGAAAAPGPAAPPVTAPVTPTVAPAVTPPVRHHAADLGIDLAEVTGTGKDGRITRHDVDLAATASAARTPTAAPVPASAAPPAPAGAGSRARVSPLARRLAAEAGLDLATVRGTGPDGAVRAEDVRAAAHPSLAPAPAPASATAEAPQAPQAPVPPLGARTDRAVVAALMSRSKREIPHYYVATTVDLHTTVTWLHRLNRDRPVSERIVPAAALLRATALAARRVPQLNGFWVDGAFVPGEDVHLGVAVAVRNSALVAPALHGAADLDVAELMARLRDLVVRARTGRLTRAELTDPTLTVTDLGDQGVEEVIGVIRPPQVALVGIGRIVERPWAVDGLVGVRPVVRITLSGDHRATDGNIGARFLATVDELLQRPEEEL